MSSTISGNVGGASASGARVVCTNVATNVEIIGAADGSGNYSFSGLSAGLYRIQASLATKQYLPGGKSVLADGSSTYANTNLSFIAANAANGPDSGLF